MAKKKGAGGKPQDYDKTNGQYDEFVRKIDKLSFKSKQCLFKRCFINIQLFATDYSNYTNSQLRKSLNNHRKRLEEHTYKQNNPEVICNDWEKINDKQKKGRVEYWEKEIKNIKNQISKIEKEIEKKKWTHLRQ